MGGEREGLVSLISRGRFDGRPCLGGEGGDARPNNEDERCGRGDHAQNDVVLRNVGGERGERKRANYCDRFSFFFFSFFFFLNHMVIVSTVQEMTSIFNDMAKTKPKIKLTINK